MGVKLGSENGVSAVVIILAIAVLVMSAVTVYPYLRSLGDGTALGLDRDQESAAKQAGRLLWADRLKSFIGIFDPTTKQIVLVGEEGDTERRHYSVEPYGMANEHRGMVIVVTTDDLGVDYAVHWTLPSGISGLIANERERG